MPRCLSRASIGRRSTSSRLTCIVPRRSRTSINAASATRGGEIIEYDGWTPVRIKGVYVRDEQEQATYLRELLDVFYAEGVDAGFVCTFIQWHLPHRDDPERDLDMGSVGIVKVVEDGLGQTYPDMPWEPKAAFAAVAEYYQRGT
jgi:hypothetical protein